jgi:hypothetical protein
MSDPESYYQNHGPLSNLSADELEEVFGKSDFYTYELDFAAVLHGGVTPQTLSFTVQTDANFLWQEAVMFADIGAAAFTVNSQPVPNILMLITDTGAGRQLMNAPVPVTNIFGLGREPKVLRNPRWFAKMATVQVQVNNIDAAIDYNLRLSFIGTKFFGA